jgi:hypothetical protein
MDAEFSIELGRDDPVLDFPWKDPSGKFAYCDLKRHPELIASIAEAGKYPELAEFLLVVNSAASIVETAKCDVWETTELSADEDIYEASHKFASYVDAVFSEAGVRLLSLQQSLSIYEQFARHLVKLLQRSPESHPLVRAEVCVRRCYFGDDGGMREGCYFTLYVSGYGNDDDGARRNWGTGLKIIGAAMLQLSAKRAAEGAPS